MKTKALTFPLVFFSALYQQRKQRTNNTPCLVALAPVQQMHSVFGTLCQLVLGMISK